MGTICTPHLFQKSKLIFYDSYATFPPYKTAYVILIFKFYETYNCVCKQKANNRRHYLGKLLANV